MSEKMKKKSAISNINHIVIGDTVWSKEHPEKKYKVLGVWYDYARGGKEFVYIQDQETKETEYVLSDVLTKTEIKDQNLWRNVWEPGNTELTSELELMKKVEKVASNKEIERYSLMLLPYLEKLSGADMNDVEKFVKSASFGYEDEKLVLTNDRKTLIASLENEEIKDVKYYLENNIVNSKRFFASTNSIIIEKCGSDGYIATVDDKKFYIDQTDILDFCNDWNLDMRAVNSSLTKFSQYTTSYRQIDKEE